MFKRNPHYTYTGESMLRIFSLMKNKKRLSFGEDWVYNNVVQYLKFQGIPFEAHRNTRGEGGIIQVK